MAPTGPTQDYVSSTIIRRCPRRSAMNPAALGDPSTALPTGITEVDVAMEGHITNRNSKL